ncbi:MAG: Crossover junction endodeoxyribonuclease RuvC [Parcubacteria group bacterium GW2011_GWA2_47_21]|nr:MAG: Crossover junction endodeoxyribonuclease RuvC [Parcubacteria group bacterium GW2011_GWA2_47_21]
MRIIAIDPGYGRMGAAVLEGNRTKYELLHSECFITDKSLPQSQRLAALSEKLSLLIKKFSPEILALEALLWSSNQKTAIKVAEVRGIILAAAGLANIPVKEFNPLVIKVAVTGYGRSDKRQVGEMVRKLLKMKGGAKRFDDEYDALAIALTCLATENPLSTGGGG